MENTDNTVHARIEGLIKLTNDLSDIFEQENQFLVSKNTHEFSLLQSDKAKLATAYASAIREFAGNRTYAEEAGTTLLNALRDSTVRFNTLAANQTALLEGAHLASSKLVQVIKTESQKGRSSEGSGYDKIGAGSQSTRPVVVSMNERA